MAPTALFISYSHRDMSPTDWLERLKLYLAPLRRSEPVDIWDDSRIQPGAVWRSQIKSALDRASAAILLVGPGFLASDFIHGEELPVLLSAAATRGTRIYPVVVGYCAYRRSQLESYQSFNDPDKPLEALPPPEQNRILNEVASLVDQDLRESKSSARQPAADADIPDVLRQIQRHLESTRTAFTAQCRRRNKLVDMIKERLGITETLQYESFFFRYHGKLNQEEHFQFEQIRAITEGPLYEGNRKILDLIESHPTLLDSAPLLGELRQHLVFWLNKYDRVFAKRPEMCLLYTGVEDGVPFPSGVDKQIKALLKSTE
jgi:hypothetical protein